MGSPLRFHHEDLDLYDDSDVPDSSWGGALDEVFASPEPAPRFPSYNRAARSGSEEVEVQPVDYFDLNSHFHSHPSGSTHPGNSSHYSEPRDFGDHEFRFGTRRRHRRRFDFDEADERTISQMEEDDSAANQLCQSYSVMYDGDGGENSMRSSRDESNSGNPDPLEGLDDFRALLEAAENDEALQTRSTSRQNKRPVPLNKPRRSKASRIQAASQISTYVRPVKRSRPNSPPKEVYECSMPRFPSEDPPPYSNDHLGVVPKYRAKNRLRSIIKRKPGTQDTDLMSSNVEILGGRVDKQTLAWLRTNFEEQPGQIMRREFLYERYLEFCQATGREAMNAACVGKVVRTVFQGLSTRRLGRRGGSKYHYVNLQVVATSPFAAMRQSIGNIQKTGRKTKKHKPPSNPWSESTKLECSDVTMEETSNLPNSATARVWAKSQKKLEAVELDFVTSGLSDEERSRRNVIQLANNCLLDAYSRVDEFRCVPEELSEPDRWCSSLGLPSSAVTGGDISAKDVVRFLFCFRMHIGMLGGLIVRLNFHCVPDIINNFWQQTEPSLQLSDQLGTDVFRLVVEIPCVQSFIKRIYHQFYDRIFTFFLPTKYGPVPDHLRLVLKDVTSKLDKWMTKATVGQPTKIRETVISSAFGFGRMVELVLDLSVSVDHLNHLEKQKSSRSALHVVLDNLLANGCLMTLNISADDRAGLIYLLTRLRELGDSRNMSEQWDTWIGDYLQQRFEFKPDLEDGSDPRVPLLRILDDFGAAWVRLCLEIEGAVRFPGFSGNGPFFGIVRYLRDTVNFALEQEKSKLLGKSMISLNAEAVCRTVRRLLTGSNHTCDYTLDHYIQCGIPNALVTSHSREFFQAIPEIAPWIYNIDSDTAAFDLQTIDPGTALEKPKMPSLKMTIAATPRADVKVKRSRKRMQNLE